MDDEKIIALYWARLEKAITETKRKYGRYCYAIAYRILRNPQDAEECENDTYLDVWNQIPPSRPTAFSTFLGIITRRISLDRFRKSHAEKRGGGETAVSLDELEECIALGKALDETIEEKNACRINLPLFTRTSRNGSLRIHSPLLAFPFHLRNCKGLCFQRKQGQNDAETDERSITLIFRK